MFRVRRKIPYRGAGILIFPIAPPYRFQFILPFLDIQRECARYRLPLP